MSKQTPDPRLVFPKPPQRTRLYEQVAEQITTWIADNGLRAGDRLPPERELASRLGVSRATLSQALVALEVVGVVAVRHGDGTVLTPGAKTGAVVRAIRAHADRLPEVIEARDALETKIAALAAQRRTDEDLAAIAAALDGMERDIDAAAAASPATRSSTGPSPGPPTPSCSPR
jgi:GntR family transcriptional repressor for pyruvate dehydrogenase complex